ncbi:MAG: tetratricopeptide repeat protein [Planctomycetes bacterium]|nr:tetratricopeptide repeat protein [Planctomycetota bacterium]
MTLAANWTVLTARAISLNDGEYLTGNYRVQNPSWPSAWAFLSEVRKPATVRGYYQPLTMISLMVDCGLGGGPDYLRPFHRTSLTLHAVNSALIALLVYLLLGQPWPAAIVGLLFGVHPMAVESLAWVGERKTLLATFFALCCLVAYVGYARRGGWKLYAVSLATFVLALLSKPTVTPLPALMLVLDVWPLSRLSRRAVLEKVPFLAVAGISAAVTVLSQQHVHIVASRQLTLFDSALLACHNAVFYPWKMLWPVNLCSVYPFPEPFGLSQPRVLAAVIISVLLTAGLVFSLRWTRALLAGWAFFLIALTPTLLNAGYGMGVAADKYAYFPALGLLLALAWAMSRGFQPAWSLSTRRALVIVPCVLLAAGLEARATRDYLEQWQTTERLSRHVLAAAPGTAWAHGQLGSCLLKQGRSADALAEYEEAVRLEPDWPTARVNLGLALMQQRRLAEAEAQLRAALDREPGNSAAHNAMGAALAAQGRSAQAMEHFRSALQSRPEFPEAHFNLALALADQGAGIEAIRQLQQALALRPAYPEAHFRLGDLLAAGGRGAEAVAHYRQALQLAPDEPVIHANLGIELAKMGRVDQAIVHFQRTVQLAPTVAGMRANLARALAGAGHLDEAIEEYRRALQIDPSHAAAHSGLEAALAKRAPGTAPG